MDEFGQSEGRQRGESGSIRPRVKSARVKSARVKSAGSNRPYALKVEETRNRARSGIEILANMSGTSDLTTSTGIQTVSVEENVAKQKRHQLVDSVIHFVCGAIGGCTSVYVGQPLDTVKVKMQTFPTWYKNAMDCLIKTYRQDGIYRGLYAGTVPALVANAIENSILFMCYRLSQKTMAQIVNKDISNLSNFEHAVCGATAAVCPSFALCPTELVKCRLQAMREMASQGKLQGGMERMKIGPFGLAKEIVQLEGIRGLYKGLTATLMREVPGYFLYFGGYELCRTMFTPPGKTKDDIGAIKTLISGGIGGVSLWVGIFPADVVKSRIQIASTAGLPEPSFRAMFMKVLNEEGVRALYKGLGPTVARTFPATGALFLAYETSEKAFGYWADKILDY